MTDRFLDAMSSRRASALTHVPVAAGLLQDGHARMKGWLEKERGFLGLRKKRYFVLHKSQLYYFLEESEVAQGPGAAKGSYVISSCVLRALDASEVPKGTYGIGLIPPVTNHLTVLLCPSEEVRIEWLSALMAAGAREDETRNPELMKAREKQKEAVAAAAAAAAANTGAISSQGSDGAPRRSGTGSVVFTMAPFPSHSTFADRMFPTSSLEGYLLKLGGLRKTSFQPRYFVLLGSQLIYFTSYSDFDSAKGTINLHQCGLEIETNAKELYGHDFVFYLLPADKKKASLMSTLFGETLDRYALVAETAKQFEEWISDIRTEIERSATAAAAEAADGADERSDEEANSDDETSTSTSSSASSKQKTTPGQASPFDLASSTSTTKDHSVSSGSLGDLVSHLYKLDEEDYATALASNSNPHWSKRFYALDLKAHQLKVWKHKPTMLTLNKFKTLDLPPGTKIRIAKDDMVCNKTQKQRKFSPSVIAIHFTTPAPGSILYLAPTSKSKFEEWYSVLLLTLGKARTVPQQQQQQQQTPPQPANLQIPIQPSATASASKPPRTHVKSQRSDSSANTPSMSQSQMLAEMGEALGDADAMTHFRTRSVELHKGVITPAQYFKSYFRLFGKDRGYRFWRDLVHYVPREEIRDELRSLYKAHASLLDPANLQFATSGSNGNPPTPSERRSSGRTSPAPSMLDPANSSFRMTTTSPLAAQLDPTPSFYPTAPNVSGRQSPMSPSSDEISPAPEFPPQTNKRHSTGQAHQQQSQPPSQPQSPQNQTAPSSSSYSFSKSHVAGGGGAKTNTASSPSSGSLHTTESFSSTSFSASNSFSTSNSFNSNSQQQSSTSNPTVVVGSVDPAILREALTHSVENWRVRCENHIITLLCTLHEILPELVTSGQFIPPMDSGFPTLREVKQTFNKAVIVIHPDKNKTHKSKKVQILTELVFQCLQQAFEKHERMEKKKEKKAAASTGSSN